MKQIIVVTGSRTWTNVETINRMLQSIVGWKDAKNVILYHGEARGADRIAGMAAMRFGLGKSNIRVRPANWDKYGKAAGRIRNLEMLVEAMGEAQAEIREAKSQRTWNGDFRLPLQVLAFYKGEFSAGTQMMIDYARLAGLDVDITRDA